MPMSRAVKSRIYSVLTLIENRPFPFDRRMCHLAETLHGAGCRVSVTRPKVKDHDQSSFEVVGGIKVYHYTVLLQTTQRLGYVLE
jgi:hypothetical protein